MRKHFNLALVGATGLVGQSVFAILQERKFPVDTLYLLASERSAGETMMFNKHALCVTQLADFDFKHVDIAFFTAGSAISAQYVPEAIKNGCLVIDNTAHYRYDKDVPLVIPEVNPEALAGYKKRLIIANPNCATIQMLVALKPIYDAVGIARINVVTFQSVSGAGKRAFQELIQQTTQLLNGLPIKKPHALTQQIAFNVIPQIDVFEGNGYTREEMKMVWETQKILSDKEIQINSTAVRVPVFYGHSEAVHIETKQKISIARAKQLLKKAAGVCVLDKSANNGYPTPFSLPESDDVMVGRLREDISHPLGLDMWIVADNIRKGAALNAIQIAELMIKNYLHAEK
ncbi:aspartate-semialdehyde dehydrogenase [Rickettsiella grylli]|uniref:Aspartate-semialdehyde dehydrogenase n=2 Tax=Rickettsiella grylli TaxID=59196 RepID=A8PNM1_9COXI|nr:aspartate-semialdehyde dehydrogenase [Rickettsiella grylli]EDP46172.1 aspartate-semialdehyde dehydrogenase [Rickettsiella grylli]